MSHDKPEPRSSFAVLPTTSWTLLQRINAAADDERQNLLSELFRQYWKPLYAYFRRKGQSASDAEDLVQGLLTRLTRKPERFPQREKTSRFRTWLLTCARNYLRSVVRHEKAKRRKPSTPIVSLGSLRETIGPAYEPAANDSPEEAFHDAWRRDLLQAALNAVAAEAEERGRSQDFQIFLDYYTNGDPVDAPTWKELADHYGLVNWRNAVHRADWAKRRLAQAIRCQVRAYVNSEDDASDELRDLLS